jgi:hypothetical protein
MTETEPQEDNVKFDFWYPVIMSLFLASAFCAWVFLGQACAAVKPLADTTADVATEACKFAPALAQSPALQLEAERLGIDVEQLVDLVCQSAELYNEYLRARDARMADPGVAVVVRLRGSR